MTPKTNANIDVYFDAHSDMLSNVTDERALGRRGVIADEFLPGMAASRIEYRVAAVFIDDSYLPEQALRRAITMIAALYRELETTDAIRLATAAPALDRVNEQTHTLVLGLEGAEPLMGELSTLDIFHRLGVRLLTLTHSRRNAVGEGCFYDDRRTGTRGGITEFGLDVIERLDELGIVLDVSHLNQTGFWDVVEFVDYPFIASHSNCRAIHDHPRNLTDAQLKAIADAGGVIGLTPVAGFIGPDPTIEDFLAHVDHAVDVAGVDHVGFGFDFYEYMAKHRAGWDPDDPPFGGMATGIESDAEVQNLAPALRDRGFDAQAVAKLTHENFLDSFQKILPEKT